MSRSGYSDDLDPLALGRWRQAVKRAIEGKRGQAALQELADALDAMPVKHLHDGSFATADGEFCTLGVLGAKRGTKMDDLGDAFDGCEPELVGERFGIARALAAEIMYLNDEDTKFQPRFVDGQWRYICETPAERWARMRKWVADHLARVPRTAP